MPAGFTRGAKLLDTNHTEAAVAAWEAGAASVAVWVAAGEVVRAADGVAVAKAAGRGPLGVGVGWAGACARQHR